MSLFDDVAADIDAQLVGEDFGVEIVYFPSMAASVAGLFVVLNTDSAVTDEIGNIVEYRDEVTINRADFNPKKNERFERVDTGIRYRFEARISGDDRIENWQIRACS